MSKDESASLITVVPLQPAQAEYAVRQIITPVVANVSKTESQVMEILRVRWIFDAISGAGSSKVIGFLNVNTFREDGPTADDTSMINDVDDTRNFALATMSTEFTTSGSRSDTPDIVVDLTDGAGNGVIIATRSLDVVVGRQAGIASDISRCEIYYKVKRIKATEFVTVVSQQLSTV